jgi:pyruvate kinase
MGAADYGSMNAKLEHVAKAIEALRLSALEAERELAAELRAVTPASRESARNLAHYLAVRRHDIRELQDELARLGLSSLGRMEAHVMASLEAVGEAVRLLRGDAAPGPASQAGVTMDSGPLLLSRNAAAILGAPLPGLDTRIMVTMPGEAAYDRAMIRDLVSAGMGIMRVNGAHDDPEAWDRMSGHLRAVERELGQRCRIEFDLAGPKLRTGPMSPGPPVIKWRPKRNALGHVVEPATIRLVPVASDQAMPEAIPTDADFIACAHPGDTVELTDTRGRKRVLTVVASTGDEATCETETTAYVVPDLPLVLRRNGLVVAESAIGRLPARERSIVLQEGDRLHVTRGDEPGVDSVHDEEGNLMSPAMVSCAVEEMFDHVRPGEPILFDDGRIQGVIRKVLEDRIEVEVTQAVGGSAKLRAEKGINLPDSALALPALGEHDLAALRFMAKRADMVAMSFVQRPEDIAALIDALAANDAARLGIVLKIETRAGFERLPQILLAAMRHPHVAVMVARGDLGVEVGFERLSEVQEEILWLCEAAHVPVIWATQVLESLAKGGMPSRAEVTDAAMSSRAECVMLNKGPYIRQTLRFLVGVLSRMHEHQRKKTARLRRLKVSVTRPRRAVLP